MIQCKIKERKREKEREIRRGACDKFSKYLENVNNIFFIKNILSMQVLYMIWYDVYIRAVILKIRIVSLKIRLRKKHKTS